MLLAGPVWTECVLPFRYHRRVIDHYERPTTQQKILVLEAFYLRLEAAVRSEDASNFKARPQHARPQGSGGSRYGNPHYAPHFGLLDAQALMGEPDRSKQSQEKIDREK